MMITFPSKTLGGPNVQIEAGSRVVIIGANGAGKTRLGIWLENVNQNQMTVQRISAQKALGIPEYAAAKNVEEATKELIFGRSDQHANLQNKTVSRWGGDPVTHLLSDYDKMLSLLFAKEHERDHLHAQQTRSSQQYLLVPDSPIDTIVKLWGDLMPHRTISFADGKVMAGKGTASEYHAKGMSDGERVTLYLLGQCLCAPTDAMLIIDEPEMHLHRSLMDKLWNKLEQLCPYKTLIYITHDLDFAASRSGAQKVWVQSFDGHTWIWRDVPMDDALPEALVLEIIGNRKPLLFCEGERGSLDHTIYQICYPHLHVVPRGGCDKVMEATKALKTNDAFHTLSARGIVDRDRRDASEVSALASHDIFVLQFAEIENLLCTEELVRLVAAQLSFDPDKVVTQVKDVVLAALQSELEAQAVMRAELQIRRHLSAYSSPSLTEPSLQQGLTNLLANLNIATIITNSKKTFHDAIVAGRLNDLLEVYNRKSLPNRVASCFGMKSGEYADLVVRLLKGADAKKFTDALLTVLPQL